MKLLGRKKQPARVASARTGAYRTPFAAVEIACTSGACVAVQKVKGKRLLTNEAPFLPLADCDDPLFCRCRYRHHADRRAGPRRKAEGALPSGPVRMGAERRMQTDRRRSGLG